MEISGTTAPTTAQPKFMNDATNKEIGEYALDISDTAKDKVKLTIGGTLTTLDAASSPKADTVAKQVGQKVDTPNKKVTS